MNQLRGLFVLMALVLVASVAATFFVGHLVLAARDEVKLRDEILAQLQSVLSAMQDAETGQRGFLLTEDEAYLEPHRNAVQVIQKRLEGLKDRAAAGQLPAETVTALELLVTRKLEELQRTIDLAQTARREEALKFTRRGEGKDTMDQTRACLTTLANQQQEARARANERDRSWTLYRTAMFIFTAAVNLVFLVWVYKRLRHEMSQQYVASLETERQREILAVTLASIGDAVIITDTRGMITFLNKVAADLTGWNAAEAQGQSCAKVFHIINETSRLPVESPVEKVLASGAIVGLANHTLLIRKDGSEVPIDDSGAPIREADGTVRGVVLVFRDFSAHKETERTLISTRRQAEDASKAKDEFLATLSHELRTPLTPVLATLSAWETNRQLPSSLEPELKLIRRNIQLEARLIDDLLDISRIEHGKLFLEKEVVDAHGLIVGVVALFKPDAEAHGVTLTVSLGAGEMFVDGDPARLQQVLWNIVGNAMKFTSRGRRITVTTENALDGKLKILIGDDGVGMSPDTIKNLFRSFQQGDQGPENGPRGLGLGLSIAHALVDAHGGTIMADSEGPGLGSTFTIVLPTVPAPVQVPPLATPQAVSGKSRRILLLEDHEDTAKVLSQVIRGMGHLVETCGTVAAARDLIERQEFDLILSDLGLPDGSGLDFIRAVRFRHQIPAIALTGYGTFEDVQKCLEAGFDSHLTKPVDFEKLQKALREVRRSGV